MSRLTKLVTVLLIFVLAISIITATAFAVDLDGGGIDDDIVVTDPPVPVETTIYVEPTYATEYVPATEPTYYEPETEPYYEPETEPIVTEPYYDDWYDDSNDDQQSSDLYVGGGQTYIPPQSTAPSASLYDANTNMDDSVLSSNDWKDISSSLKNASNDGNDSDDFSFIKNNDSTSDNGEWMLYGGIICLLLSAAGIAYVIYSTVSKKNKLSKGANNRQYAYAGNARRGTSDKYDDGYQSSVNKKRQIDRSRRFDTADVRLPKSTGNRYKNNGKRYK